MDIHGYGPETFIPLFMVKDLIWPARCDPICLNVVVANGTTE